jgi:hypothetical protein
MPGHSKWRDIRHARPPIHHFMARRRYRPWWGLGLIVRWRELHVIYEGEEADALRSLRSVFADTNSWTIRRAP